MSHVRRYVVSRAEWAKQRRLFAFTRLSDGLDQLEEQARAPVWTSLGPCSEPHQATRRCVHGQTAFLHVKAILTDVPIGHCQHQSRPNQSTDPTSSSPKEASFCCLAWASAQRAARMTALLSSRIYKKKMHVCPVDICCCVCMCFAPLQAPCPAVRTTNRFATVHTQWELGVTFHL